MQMQNTAPRTRRDGAAAVALPLVWVFLSLNYILCDLLSNMEAGTLRGLLEGVAGGFPVSQGFLLFAGVTLELPILMTLLSAVLPGRANTIVNVCAAGLLIVYQAGSFFVGSGTSLHYAFFSAIEILGNALVVFLALRRKR